MGDIINSFSRKHTASKPKQQNCAILYIPTLGYLEELLATGGTGVGGRVTSTGFQSHINFLPKRTQEVPVLVAPSSKRILLLSYVFPRGNTDEIRNICRLGRQ